jgi:hypothetical protein
MYRRLEARPSRPSATFLDALETMTPEQRLRAYRSGSFSRSERTSWAARYRDEVPLLNGELEWIALGLADLD